MGIGGQCLDIDPFDDLGFLQKEHKIDGKRLAALSIKCAFHFVLLHPPKKRKIPCSRFLPGLSDNVWEQLPSVLRGFSHFSPPFLLPRRRYIPVQISDALAR